MVCGSPLKKLTNEARIKMGKKILDVLVKTMLNILLRTKIVANCAFTWRESRDGPDSSVSGAHV